jgi:hypothetical protein
MLLPAKVLVLLLVQQNPLSGTKTFSQKRYPSSPPPLPQLALLSFPQLSDSFPFPPYHLSVLCTSIFRLPFPVFSLSCRLPGSLWSKPVCLCLSEMSQPVYRCLSLLSQSTCMGLSHSLPAFSYLIILVLFLDILLVSHSTSSLYVTPPVFQSYVPAQ